MGMSCPPPAFVEKGFLQKVKTILKPEGRRNPVLSLWLGWWGMSHGATVSHAGELQLQPGLLHGIWCSWWVLDPGVSVGVVTGGSRVEQVAHGTAVSGKLRHPRGPRKVAGRQSVGIIWEQIVWQQGHGAGPRALRGCQYSLCHCGGAVCARVALIQLCSHREV